MSNKPIIVVLDDFERVARSYADWSGIDSRADVRVHTEPLRGQALIDALKPASAIVLMRDRTPLLADLIDQLPNLKLVHFTGTRNGALDTEALAARDIPVLHTGWGAEQGRDYRNDLGADPRGAEALGEPQQCALARRVATA